MNGDVAMTTLRKWLALFAILLLAKFLVSLVFAPKMPVPPSVKSATTDLSNDLLQSDSIQCLIGKTLELKLAACDRVIKAAEGDHQRLAGALTGRANTYYISGKFTEAKADLKQALTLEPRSTDAMMTRSEIAIEEGRYEDALADQNDAISIDGETSYFLFERGLTNYFMRRLDKAAADFAKAQELGAEDIDTLLWHSFCLSELGQDDQGVLQASLGRLRAKAAADGAKNSELAFDITLMQFAIDGQNPERLVSSAEEIKDQRLQSYELTYIHYIIGHRLMLAGGGDESLRHFQAVVDLGKERSPMFMAAKYFLQTVE